MTLLEARSVSCGYGKNTVISGLSFAVEEGEFLGIIGPNGAGKTTLFRLITGLLRPSQGQVLYRGKDNASLSRLARAREIATMPQMLESAFSFPVEEFVSMGRFPHRRRWEGVTARDREIVEKAMEETGTAALRKRLLHELSGGERQRVLLAQALAQEPRLLLLDEPTAHLDIGHQVELLELARRLNREQKLTIVAILHDLNLAGEYCNKLLLLNAGRIHQTGTPEEVLTYQNIETVYRTVVVVKRNPISSKPFVIPIAKDYIGKR